MIPTLRLPKQNFVVPQSEPTASNTVSAASLFEQALTAPFDFPALADFLYEGDHVAFVLVGDLQAKSDSVDALLHYLLNHAAGCRIDIVSAEALEVAEETRNDWIERLKQKDIELGFCQHDPGDIQQMAYIAASYSGEPIYINRNVFEADTVIPVFGAGNADPSGRPAVYPEFSNTATIERHNNSSDVDADQQRGETRMAHEFIGICFVIEVDSGLGGQVAGVQAGEFSRVATTKESGSDETQAKSQWQIERCADAKVVVATIESPETGQTWDHFFRALAASAAVSENVQQIVICCSIDSEPSDVFRQLLQIPFESDFQVIDNILQNAPDFCRAVPGIFEESTVYLKSGLDESTVEELGLGFIACDSEIQRIIDNAESGIYLREAHHCKISD